MNALTIKPGDVTRDQVLATLNASFDEVMTAVETEDDLPSFEDTFTRAVAALDRGDTMEIDRRVGELITIATLGRTRLRVRNPTRFEVRA